MVNVKCIECGVEAEISEIEYEAANKCEICGGFICSECSLYGKRCSRHKEVK